jgi:hypothetical protein
VLCCVVLCCGVVWCGVVWCGGGTTANVASCCRRPGTGNEGGDLGGMRAHVDEVKAFYRRQCDAFLASAARHLDGAWPALARGGGGARGAVQQRFAQPIIGEGAGSLPPCLALLRPRSFFRFLRVVRSPGPIVTPASCAQAWWSSPRRPLECLCGCGCWAWTTASSWCWTSPRPTRCVRACLYVYVCACVRVCLCVLLFSTCAEPVAPRSAFAPPPSFACCTARSFS